MLKDRKILVTGATGQIAGPIAENFANDNEVWCAARFSDPGRKSQLEELGVKTCVWDIDAAQAHLLLEVASVPATVVNWAGDDTVSDREMGEYVAELTGITPSFAESPISFDSFPSDNTRRERLIGRCSTHWKDGVRDTFERLGIV